MTTELAGLKIFDADAVRRGLTYEAAIPLMRSAMIALSSGEALQQLRSYIGLGEGRTFAIMPAALGASEAFGAKLVSVFNDGTGRKAHQGVVVLFEPETGRPVAIADAAEITEIRTAAASAAATDALARDDAAVLAVLGCGRQALAHITAIRAVRNIREVRIWGRDPVRAAAFARQVGGVCGPASDVLEGADIICTVTAAIDPILRGAWVGPGAHVNLVGSSGPGQAEADAELVARARFIVDHRQHVLVHGGEFLRARAAGLVGEDHIAGEIGEVYAGRCAGRRGGDEITLYKSLGHAVQDLAACAHLLKGAA